MKPVFSQVVAWDPRTGCGMVRSRDGLEFRLYYVDARPIPIHREDLEFASQQQVRVRGHNVSPVPEPTVGMVLVHYQEVDAKGFLVASPWNTLEHLNFACGEISRAQTKRRRRP